MQTLVRNPLADPVVLGITPGAMTLDDLAGYEAVTRDPVCSPYRDHAVCGMAPPSSGPAGVVGDCPSDRFTRPPGARGRERSGPPRCPTDPAPGGRP